MKINYFILYPDNTYEFFEKEEQSEGRNFLRCIENTIGDYCWFYPLNDYPGYFIAFNDGVSDSKLNKLAESFTHEEEFDKCVLVKCYEGQAIADIEFEIFTEDDKKEFEDILNEKIKEIKNESNPI